MRGFTCRLCHVSYTIDIMDSVLRAISLLTHILTSQCVVYSTYAAFMPHVLPCDWPQLHPDNQLCWGVVQLCVIS